MQVKIAKSTWDKWTPKQQEAFRVTITRSKYGPDIQFAKSFYTAVNKTFNENEIEYIRFDAVTYKGRDWHFSNDTKRFINLETHDFIKVGSK